MIYTTKERLEAFKCKQAQHKHAVMGYYKTLLTTEFFEEICLIFPKLTKEEAMRWFTERVSKHDDDKLYDEETLSLFAARYFKNLYNESIDPKVQLLIDKAVLKHRNYQEHHAESVAWALNSVQGTWFMEMIADWAAVSEELGNNAHTWFLTQLELGNYEFSSAITTLISHALQFLSPLVDENRKLQRFGNNPESVTV